jgi:hypothetical protein
MDINKGEAAPVAVGVVEMPVRHTPPAWQLTNLKKVRKRLTAEIRTYARLSEPSRAETDRFKAVVYALSLVAAILKDERQDALEERIAALEAEFERPNGPRRIAQ